MCEDIGCGDSTNSNDEVILFLVEVHKYKTKHCHLHLSYKSRHHERCHGVFQRDMLGSITQHSDIVGG